jgi:hypothetical protein
MNAKADRFHGYADAEFAAVRLGVVQTKQTKSFIIRERQVSYQFYPHFHPYIGKLTQKLLRGGTTALQAADTQYAADNASLAGSIEVALVSGLALTIPAGARIALVAEVQGTANAVPITLQPNLELELGVNAQATLADGMKARLVDGMTGTPPAGATFGLAANSNAVVAGDTNVALTAATTVLLHDGTQATIPAVAGGTTVLLTHGTRVAIPIGTQVTLLKSKRRPQPEVYADFFVDRYQPSEVVQLPYPVKDLDFTFSGAYSAYNWELFFHVPIMIAIHLSKNQRFAEAQRWFHYLFDPTDDSDGPTPERFWKVRPFQYTDVKKIEEILTNLSTNAEPALRSETIRSIDAWKDAPFRPHVIARYRQQAYMYKTVMAYLDNLVAWGDSLFRQDTGEAIDEALMLYVLAANILGPRPLPVPKKGKVRPQTYNNLRQDLQKFGATMREVEADGAFDLMPFPTEAAGDTGQLATLRGLGKALYFCVPRNDKLLSYWDTVADRLFKIRNSLNFQGIFRQLPLFEPPIDPAMLARAAAAGLDVGAIVNGLNQPLPLVRFQLLVQKASEVVQEVKSLGNNMLAAMEKEDGETLAILRAKHERVVMEMVEHVKYGQLQEAIKAKEGLLKSLALAVQRYAYYEQQLGRKVDEIGKAIPELGELDKDSLDKMKFAMKEPELALRGIDVDIATDAFADAASALNGGKLLSSHEVREALFLEGAQIASDIASVLNVASSVASVVPQFEVSAEPWGMGGATQFGGQNVASGIQAAANASRAIADRLNFEARRASRIDSFARRERDWAFQGNLAAGEITQVFKQLRAAQIREAIAEVELKNHRQQIKHAVEIERFLNEEGTEKKGKKTNKSLYVWLKREVKGLYAQFFQFAFDIAKKAERALQHELGNKELTFLQFGYLAGKEGLLAGEKLYLDVKRMEMAYHDLNQREYELTKHVSLLQVDPLALVKLRATGRCTVRLPEAVFDMDGPGHYFRRIKTVALSIPCVTGPYASVNCTLTLLKSSIRTSRLLRDGIYAREDAEDDRFSDNFSSLQSIVTSSAQNDSGLFETNLRDERYLPFENSGLESEWQLQMPANPSKNDPQQFDYKTISDVILHMRYTAREGGELLRAGAVGNLKQLIADAAAAGSLRLFAVRNEFPSEWAKLKNTSVLTLDLRKEHFPLWMQTTLADGKQLDAQVIVNTGGAGVSVNGTMLVKDPTLGNMQTIGLKKIDSTLPKPDGTFFRLTLQFTDEIRAADDLWLALSESQAV